MTAIRRLHLLVEGQTEETIVGEIIGPHLEACGWSVSVSILKTKRLASGRAYKGGVSSWEKIRNELRLLLKSHDLVSTVIDYYGFPQQAPGMRDRPDGDPYRRVTHVESALAVAIGDRRFLPHLVLHELESWVLAAGEPLAALVGDKALAGELRKLVDDSGGAELVNDGPATAPSKRLAERCPRYQKTLDGPLALSSFGLHGLREQCQHLDEWLRRIEAWQ